MGLPAVAMRDKSMPDRIEETPSAAGVNQAVVSGIFREDCRIGEIREPPPGCLSGEVGAEAFSITLRALFERGSRFDA
jgi:hypothetical protein